MSEVKNLWEEIGNKCLQHANKMLEGETVPTAATAETVRTLVETAISIDVLNLRWIEKSRSGERVSQGQPWGRLRGGN